MCIRDSFQNDLDDVVKRYDILRRAEILPSGIAVAAIPEDGDVYKRQELVGLLGVVAEHQVPVGVGAGGPSAEGLGEMCIRDSTDAVKMTITAVGSDNGILCDGDNMLLHPAEEEKALFDTMRQEGVVVFDKPEDVDKFREVLFVNGKSNPALVGKDATVIAKRCV